MKLALPVLFVQKKIAGVCMKLYKHIHEYGQKDDIVPWTKFTKK
jgi:hypothetical protein